MKWKKENKTKLDGGEGLDESPESQWVKEEKVEKKKRREKETESYEIVISVYCYAYRCEVFLSFTPDLLLIRF